MDGIRIAWAPATADTRRLVVDRLLRDLGGGASVARTCPRCGGPHGAPLLTGDELLASAAYVRDGMSRIVLAVTAVTSRRGIDGFGIDAEAGRPDEPANVSALTDAQSLRDWVRLEASVKADGRLLRVDPALVRVRPARAGWMATLPDALAVHGRDLDGPPGVVLSAAWRRR